MAVIIYSDPKTGFPLAIMDGTQITNFRTGASGAVAAKYLARRDAKTLGLVGCGVQAQTQLLALSKIFKFSEIYIYDISRTSMDNFKKVNSTYPLREVSLAKVSSADIICTTTTSRVPVVKKEWIKKGAHINAIGADAPGKQELDSDILKEAKIVVDDFEQATHSGEVNVPLSHGVIKVEDIYATLGEVVTGIKKGRDSRDEITVFDSTGLAIQDIAVAKVIFETAREKGLGQEIDIVGSIRVS
jgi:alanine dehydrogenase